MEILNWAKSWWELVWSLKGQQLLWWSAVPISMEKNSRIQRSKIRLVETISTLFRNICLNLRLKHINIYIYIVNTWLWVITHAKFWEKNCFQVLCSNTELNFFQVIMLMVFQQFLHLVRISYTRCWVGLIYSCNS